ncbi:ornithine carbamoyltransferase [Metabacillus arenae]|uniref:Ornithine carbamoyltransferase n=1 Tax=Metabacillus arenae TaxID=2771434 RepID=A0A926NFQ2_9BACI|nr:ornithine carbamoyltransferase [Metabacillus arenae]MBD1383452.1 ornithine carbamoyltransferase [Metabacillus arenae]
MYSLKLASEKKPSLFGKDLLTLFDYTTEEILFLLEEAIELKKNPVQSIFYGKTLAMIFEKSSTRTRVSFEAGMSQLGGHALYLNSQDLQLGRGETIADTAKVLSSYVDAIMIRTFEHEKVEELAKHASVPVINGLSDLYHPCQALADLLTIYEEKQSFDDVKLTYVGDSNNVAHSLMIGCAKVGIDFTLACPKGYEPNEQIIKQASEAAKNTGGSIDLQHDAKEAVKSADYIYTDVWTSMGQEKESAERLTAFQGYQVNAELVSNANSSYKFLHCLPAHRGEEVTADIIDGVNSSVFTQAENRLHAQKALLKNVLLK